MGERYLNIFAFQVDYRIQSISAHTVFQQVLEAMARQNASAIVHYCKTCIKVSIVTEHVLHYVIVEMILQEKSAIRLKIDICSVLVLRIFCFVCQQDATFKCSASHFTVAIRCYLEVRAKSVHGFHTHAIKTYRFLERLRVILTTSIQHRYCFDKFSLRDTTSIVAHTDT